jgi:RNA polymerase sigma-70 factor (ECF subfamily)
LLIRRVISGDIQAFDTLVRKYYKNIYAYCYRRTRDENIAADLTQDVFLKVISTIYKYKFTGKFSNFLFTIALNTCNDYNRKSSPIIDYDMNTLTSIERQPLEQIIKNEEAQKLHERLYALPDIQREALILYYYHDLKAKDIATITGTPLATTKSRIKQGLDKLKKAYYKGDDYEKEKRN